MGGGGWEGRCREGVGQRVHLAEASHPQWASYAHSLPYLPTMELVQSQRRMGRVKEDAYSVSLMSTPFAIYGACSML